MQEQIREINSRRLASDKEVLYMGICINTGEAIVGNIGSEKRDGVRSHRQCHQYGIPPAKNVARPIPDTGHGKHLSPYRGYASVS